MKRLGYVLLFLVAGALYPLYLTWGGLGIYTYKSLKTAGAAKKGTPLACSVNADCPPGYMCLDGRCIPEQA